MVAFFFVYLSNGLISIISSSAPNKWGRVVHGSLNFVRVIVAYHLFRAAHIGKSYLIH